jgi:DNA-binding HxlR family transcriptional regulator
MEEDGLVDREIFAEVPPRVEYTLTELGESLKPVLDAMKDWGINYQEKSTVEVDYPKVDAVQPNSHS